MYIATLRAIYNAANAAEAQAIADQIALNGAVDLELEEDETLSVTQVTDNSEELQPAELCQRLRQARNGLLRTRIREAYDQARELDKFIYVLQHRQEEDFQLAGYDWSSFVKLATEIWAGKHPSDD